MGFKKIFYLIYKYSEWSYFQDFPKIFQISNSKLE